MLLGRVGKQSHMAFLVANSVISYVEITHFSEWYLWLTLLNTLYSGTMSLSTWFLGQPAASTALRQASATARHVFCSWIRPGECCISKPAFQCAFIEHKPSSLCRLSSFYKGWKNLTFKRCKILEGLERK